MRQSFLMNFGWRFHRGDLPVRNFNAIHAQRFDVTEWIKAGNHGPSLLGFPDADWEPVDLPHDFVVATGEFAEEHDRVHGSMPTDIGWYRKTFELPADDFGKRIALEFDGVYRDCQVWVNGHFIGRHLSGYTSFAFDVTDVLNYGGNNSIAVRADATLFELWSYEGGGIYRDVRLVKTDPLHVGHWGTWVRPLVGESMDSAELLVDTTVRNDSDRPQTFTLQLDVVDGEEVVLQMEATGEVPAFGTRTFENKGVLDHPRLWSCDDPHQYTLRTTVLRDGVAVDRTDTKFGVRHFRFDAKTGFYLNGEPLKLKGVCQHQDHAGVGVAIPPAVEEFRVRQMKDMGVNSIRTSHNPPSPRFLEVCDRLGILVMDEARMLGTTPELLGQLDDLIRRDRNHACVFMWSLGNEEMVVQHTEVGVRQMRRMQAHCHQLDPTRAVTYAMNCGWDKISAFHAEQEFRLDVFGGNYVCKQQYTVTGAMYDEFHERFPDWPMLGSETGGSASTRGLYLPTQPHAPIDMGEFRAGPQRANPKRDTFVSAYGETYTPWGYSVEQTWIDCIDRPFVAGTYLWTGQDYRGEIYPAAWPSVVTCYGLADLCGFPKDAYHYYRVHWNDTPALHLFPHWSWAGHEGQEIDVWCYANAVEVELFLNGTSLGRKAMPRLRHVEWAVPFTPGTIEAVAYDDTGNEIARQHHTTAGPPARLVLKPWQDTVAADGRDVAILTVSVVDADGHPVPTSDCAVRFEVDGPALLLGTGNGNPISHESDKRDHRRLHAGLAQLLVQIGREPGTVEVHAHADGLESATLRIEARLAPIEPWIPSVDADATAKVETAIDNAL